MVCARVVNANVTSVAMKKRSYRVNTVSVTISPVSGMNSDFALVPAMENANAGNVFVMKAGKAKPANVRYQLISVGKRAMINYAPVKGNANVALASKRNYNLVVELSLFVFTIFVDVKLLHKDATRVNTVRHVRHAQASVRS